MLLQLSLCRWEYDDDHYCADVLKIPMYGSGRLLLDIIDACVFDYIVGNADRHHFEVFENETESMLIMFDNGKRLVVNRDDSLVQCNYS